jgi:hypothetical protein
MADYSWRVSVNVSGLWSSAQNPSPRCLTSEAST